MSILLNGFHPSFDALSAHADQSDLDAARTRVGRHVARCAACAAEVAEIRGLGDAARAVELPGAPSGLWASIERARQEEAQGAPPRRETPPPDTDTWKAAPALRPTTHVPMPVRRGLRRGGIALAAAAVVAAVLLVPIGRGEQLQAAARRDVWRFSPATPVPGSTVTVQFVPRAGAPADSALVLLGNVLDARRELGLPWRFGAGLQDSLVTLVRRGDGSYTGRFVVPDSVSVALLHVTDLDSAGGSLPFPYAGEPRALLVTGSKGRPSLAALSMAGMFLGRGDDDFYDIGDTLVKYYPAEPLGFALQRRKGGNRRLIDNLIAWYRSGERQYLRFDERFMGEAQVSADHEIAMVMFANRIDEPGEARKWTLRLAREHGDDPRAMKLYGPMLHAMLLRVGTADSLRRDLRLADSLWERNGHRAADLSMAEAALAVHDTAAARQWELRAMLSGEVGWRGGRVIVSLPALEDRDIRRAAQGTLLAESAKSCVMPHAKRAPWSGYEGWEARCRWSRADAYGARSAAARLDGQPRLALALADSSVALMFTVANCEQRLARSRRGEALLALGDTAAAVADLAAGVAASGWQSRPSRDRVGRLLRPAVDSARWAAATGAADADLTACWQRLSAQRRAAQAAAKARQPSR